MKVNINLRHLTAMQLSSRIFYILIGVIVVLFALFWIIGYDMPYDDNPDYSAPLLTDALIWFMIVLTFATLGLAVLGASLWLSLSEQCSPSCSPMLFRAPMRSW